MSLRIYYEEPGVRIYHGDCAEVLAEMVCSGEKTDVIITDPPYDETTHKFAKTVSGGKIVMGKFDFEHLKDPAVLADAMLSVTKRWVLAFCAFEQVGDYRRGATKDRWVRTGVYRRTRNPPQISGDRPGQAAEAIAIMSNEPEDMTEAEAVVLMHAASKKRWNGRGTHAYWESAPAASHPDRHPAEKPIKMVSRLVELFTDPGECVTDLFMGAGPVLEAARDLGRRAVGVEQNERWCEVAAKRLQKRRLL